MPTHTITATVTSQRSLPALKTQQSHNPAIRRANNPALPPSQVPVVIVQIIGNRAIIYQAVQIASFELPACILEVAPIIEAAFPFWWETSQADRVRKIVFGLTKKHHLKGIHIIQPVRPKVRRKSQIIKIVRPSAEPLQGK